MLRCMLSRIGQERRDSIFGFLLLLPALIVFSMVIVLPILNGILMSFLEFTVYTFSKPVWNNFSNYRKILLSGELANWFSNTAVFTFFTVSIQFLLAFSVALALNNSRRGTRVFRSLYLIPWTIPSVVVALLWSWMLQGQYGVFNYLLHAVGILEKPTLLWTQDPTRAMPSIVIASIWQQMPYMMIMLLAGLQSVSHELVEAAQIDGAGRFSILMNVVIPSIRPVIDSVLIIAVIGNFQMFTVIYNMTAGGPMGKTMTLSLAAYSKAFTEFDLGAGSAIGVVWLIVLGTAVFFYNRASEKAASDASC